MVKRCVICKENIKEESRKLKGTMIRMKDEKDFFVYVCNDCQKQKDWIEKAKIKGA